MRYENVIEYINTKIFNNKAFTSLPDESKRIAINTAKSLLYLYYKAYKPDSNPLPIEAVAYQTLWEIDKVKVRDSELGVASQSIEGMTQTFRGLDRTVAPEVKKILRNRVGRYNLPVSHTNRHMNSL